MLRIPTDRGDLWFKANAPELRYEASVVSVLSGRRPDCVPPLLAVDLESGWMLMADAGERLREVSAREQSVDRWLDVLPLYAGLQLDLMADADELVARGAPDMRLRVLPDLYERLLDELGDALPAAQRAQLESATGRVEALAEELAGFGIRETIQHDDFHDGQVFVAGGGYRLLDWGDACVSHPFFTLAVTLGGFLSWGLDDVECSVEITPFRDAYLEPLRRGYGDRDLVRAATIALELGWVCRSVNAHFGGSDPEQTLPRLGMFLGERAD